MALEISRSQHHRYAFAIGFSVFAVSLLIIGALMTMSENVGSALTRQVMHLKTGQNGVARVSFDFDEPPLGNSIDSIGQTANQTVILESTANENNKH